MILYYDRGARNGVEILYTFVKNISGILEIWNVYTCVSIKAMNFLQKGLLKLWAKV